MRRALVVVAASSGALAACRSQPPRSIDTRPTEPGLSIALYASKDASYGIVDDRRWIEVAGPRVQLANIDARADLASLVIEPASSALRIGTCVRARAGDAADAPIVTCDVDATPGRYLVRVLYTTTALGYLARHEIDARDLTRVRVASRFSVATPAWKQNAELVLYDGTAGDERAPREIARRRVALDGSVAVLTAPVREVAGRIRHVYEGAVVTSADSTDPAWAIESVHAVWVWLELAQLDLAPGAIRVHVELPDIGTRDVDVTRPTRKQDDKPSAMLGLPLWIDESLRGSRERFVEYHDGSSLTERFVFAVTNTGKTTRKVFVEEPLRRASRRKLERAWPTPPTPDGDTLRIELDVRPGRIERSGYTLTYDF